MSNEWAFHIATLVNKWGLIHAILLVAIAGELGVILVLLKFPSYRNDKEPTP